VAIGPDDAAEKRLAPQAEDVGGNVGRASGPIGPLAQLHHGDRRLGRQPAGVATKIFVEHEVPDDEHPPPSHPRQQFCFAHARTFFLGR
jgi:hypothetical protein